MVGKCSSTNGTLLPHFYLTGLQAIFRFDFVLLKPLSIDLFGMFQYQYWLLTFFNYLILFANLLINFELAMKDVMKHNKKALNNGAITLRQANVDLCLIYS